MNESTLVAWQEGRTYFHKCCFENFMRKERGGGEGRREERRKERQSQKKERKGNT